MSLLSSRTQNVFFVTLPGGLKSNVGSLGSRMYAGTSVTTAWNLSSSPKRSRYVPYLHSLHLPNDALLTHTRHLVSLPTIRRRQPSTRRRLKLRPNNRRPHTHPRPRAREADLVHPQGTPARGAPRVSRVPTAAVGSRNRRKWIWRGRGGDGVDYWYLWET